MAGDWIPMRLDLDSDPAVIEMAESLGMPEACVVGYLHSIWSWASRNCHAGSVTGVTLEALGRVTHCATVPSLMVQVGWLEYTEADASCDGRPVITFPNWDHWMSQSAKSRLLASRRKSKQRVTQMSRSERDKNVTTVQKSTVQNSKKKKTTSKKRAFVPPTLDQVTDYADDIDAQAFLDYYTSNGWRVGRNPMKCWKAAVRNWRKRQGEFSGNGRNGKVDDAEFSALFEGIPDLRKADQ